MTSFRCDVFDLPGCGRVIFGKTVSPCRKAVKSTLVKVDSWNLSLDRPSLRRIWFTTNNTARLVVKTPIENVRWIVCDCPKEKVKISINGKAGRIDAELRERRPDFCRVEKLVII